MAAMVAAPRLQPEAGFHRDPSHATALVSQALQIPFSLPSRFRRNAVTSRVAHSESGTPSSCAARSAAAPAVPAAVRREWGARAFCSKS